MAAAETTENIRALVIDDEPAARDYIQELLKDDKSIQVVDEASDGYEAVVKILEKKPDLIFLDVQLPEMDGFEVLGHIKDERLPYVVFVTAHDKYALKAFEVNALDYLLKPFDRPRFLNALKKAKDIILSQKDHHSGNKLEAFIHKQAKDSKYLNRLLIKAKARIYFVRTEDVSYIQAAGNYIVVHTSDSEHLLREALHSMENRLDKEKFVRIHRSTIVNVDHISEIRPSASGDYSIFMLDGHELSLTRKYKDRLLAHF
jgi:two-component system LytT family response regulator